MGFYMGRDNKLKHKLVKSILVLEGRNARIGDTYTKMGSSPFNNMLNLESILARSWIFL